MQVNGAPELLCFPHSSEYLPLCSAEQRHSYRFGITWGWVNDDRIFIFGWTIPLRSLHTEWCFRMLKNKYDLTLCQSHLHTASKHSSVKKKSDQVRQSIKPLRSSTNISNLQNNHSGACGHIFTQYSNYRPSGAVCTPSTPRLYWFPINYPYRWSNGALSRWSTHQYWKLTANVVEVRVRHYWQNITQTRRQSSEGLYFQNIRTGSVSEILQGCCALRSTSLPRIFHLVNRTRSN